MKTAIIVVSLLGGLALQTPVLDLTTPPSEPYSLAGSTSSITQSPLQTVVTGIQDQPYRVGDHFEYEIEISNPTESPIAVPWSAEPLGNSATEVRMVVGMSVGRAGAPDKFFVGAFAFGDSQVPSSFHTLQPNHRVRVRAAGRWEIPQVQNLANELLQANGRYQLRAHLTISDESTAARATVSQPVWVTLMSPQ